MEFGTLLRFVGPMKLMLILSRLFSIQGIESYLCDVIFFLSYVGLYSDIYRPISFEHGMMETTKLYFSISVWMTLTFIQSHSCIEIKTLSIFSEISQSIWID